MSWDIQKLVMESEGILDPAEKYILIYIAINGQKIVLSLDFKKNIFEIGTSVINQRILFFKVEPNCKIVNIALRN